MSVMETEARDPRFDGIDTWPTGSVLRALLETQAASVAAIFEALPALETVIAQALPRLRAGGRLAYAGAGTSGRVAFQDGAELRPTFGWPEARRLTLLAGGEEALVSAVEGAEDDHAAGQLDGAWLRANDVLFAVAASGTTPYTRGVVQAARALGCLTVGIACNREAPLLDDAEVGVLIATGAEPIAGSTRMKAGTAQKVVLNLLSTTLMIGLGHVHRGWMVDMIASNDKLRRRAVAMVAAITGDDETMVRAALDAAGGEVKLAVLILSGLDVAEARARLAAKGGNLRESLP